MKKIALILSVFLLLFSLFSCGDLGIAEDAVAAAQEKMKTTRTKMSVHYVFSSDNAEVVELLNNQMPIVETVVDGNNSSAYIKAPNPYQEGDFIETKTVILGNKVYVDSDGDKTVSTYESEGLAAKIKETLDSRVDISEFFSLADAPSVKEEGERIIISFDSLKEGKNLTDFTPLLDAFLNSSVISNIKGEIVINSGVYEKAVLSFDITLENITVTTKMVINTEMDVPEITAPADADEYTDVSLDGIWEIG